MELHVNRWGSGPSVVLVHGGLLGGREAWRGQRPLTERWTLLAPDRPGHGCSPDARQDFEPEAVLVADQLLTEPVHLVGYSYGGIVAMLAAAARPEHVRTLTVIEPPATRVVQGNPVADAYDARLRELMGGDGSDLPRFLGACYELIGVPEEVPDPLPEALRRGGTALVGARPPGDAVLPLDELAGIPMLAVTGGHLPVYEIICDAIAERTGAERAVIEGRAHLVPDTGAPFNQLLESFLKSG